MECAWSWTNINCSTWYCRAWRPVIIWSWTLAYLRPLIVFVLLFFPCWFISVFLMCVGACVVIDVRSMRVVCSLHGHQDAVDTITFLPSASSSSSLSSLSSSVHSPSSSALASPTSSLSSSFIGPGSKAVDDDSMNDHDGQAGEWNSGGADSIWAAFSSEVFHPETQFLTTSDDGTVKW